MAEKILRFKKARSRSSLGRVGGTTLAAITLGMLTPPIVADVPVEVVRGGALPARNQLYIAVPRSYHHEGKLNLELESRTKVWAENVITDFHHKGQLDLQVMLDAKVRFITSEEHYETLKRKSPLELDRLEPTTYDMSFVGDDKVERIVQGIRPGTEEDVLLLMMAVLLEEED